MNCYLEYPIYKKEVGKIRVDCVILDNKKENIIAAIETKSYVNPDQKPHWNTKQMKKYKQFFPAEMIFIVHNRKSINEVINWAFNRMY